MVALLLSACGEFQSREDEETKKKNTLDCTANNQRYLLRFQDKYEVRLLMPDGDLVYLYNMPTSSGAMRYGNDMIEVRSQGLDLVLVQNLRSTKMDCKPYKIEDEKQREQDQKKLK